MLGTRPRAPCPLDKHSIQQVAPTPSPCVYILEDEEWIFGVYLGGKWKQEIFFTCLFWVTMTLSCKMFREFYRRYFCPVLDQPYKQTWIGNSPLPRLKGSHRHSALGHTRCPGFPTPGPSAQAQGSWVREGILQGQWPSGIKRQCQWAIYTWLYCPSMGTIEEKTLGIDEGKSLIIMNGIFLWKWLQNTCFKSSNFIFPRDQV